MHWLLKKSTSPARVKKKLPEIFALLNFSTSSSSVSSFGRFCWIHLSSLSLSHSFTSSIVGFGVLFVMGLLLGLELVVTSDDDELLVDETLMMRSRCL